MDSSARPRVQFLNQQSRAAVHLNSRLTAEDVAETECTHVLIATGSEWRRDGRGRTSAEKISGLPSGRVLTPDEIMGGARSNGRYLVYDDDGYYMGSAIAILLAREGAEVLYVTPENCASSWSSLTTEQYPVHTELLNLGVSVMVQLYLVSAENGTAELKCNYTDRSRSEVVDCIVPVTSREPRVELWHTLKQDPSAYRTLVRIGDCRAPGIIATAVYDGHKAARGIGLEPGELIPKRERVRVGED